MSAFIDLTGRKFGRWTVIKLSEFKNNRAYWQCQCECGKIVSVESYTLRSGKSKSCSCLQKEIAKKNKTVHGMCQYRSKKRHNKLYHCWINMVQRCTNPNVNCYKHYGGRGISVCKEWHEFIPFMNWALANGYKDDLTIDRIDVDNDYKPSNCRWATWKEQANNKRRRTA